MDIFVQLEETYLQTLNGVAFINRSPTIKKNHSSMYKQILFLSLLILTLPLLAQEKNGFAPQVTLGETTLVSSGKDLPFWMSSNQNGTIVLHNPTYQLFQAEIKRGLERDSLKKWGYTYGGNLVYGLAGGSDFQPNQYWLGVRYRSLILKAGAEADPVIYAGLSSTNGNMDHSGNARPVPGIRLSTRGYLPFLFAKKWFSFRFLYEEGFLHFDKQAISNAHLHHKNLYLRNRLSPTLFLTVGIEHYVFWGGNSPVYGQEPGWNQYFRYVLAMKGGKGASLYDRMFTAGNGLGIYNLELKKDWPDYEASFYWNHPFENPSQTSLVNIKDGLFGIHLGKKKKESFFTDFVYEYMQTQYRMRNTPPRGDDDYFNHWEYTSGFTYFQRMMGSPLFIPTIGPDGISRGFESNMMWMHHLGLGGTLGGGFSWKTLLTLSRNYGRPYQLYPKPPYECSGLLECSYATLKLPFAVKAGLAADYGSRFEHRYGGYLGIDFHF